MIKTGLITTILSLLGTTAIANLPCPSVNKILRPSDFAIHLNEAEAKVPASGKAWTFIIKSQLPLSMIMIRNILDYNFSPVYPTYQNQETVCTYQGMYPNTTFTATSSWW